MRLEAGQLVDERYELRDRLGSGGMAAVWSADDRMLGRRVALKFLHERFAQDEQFIERFRREATAAAGLQHPNVVGVYDRGEWDGAHYIAMEYVEGASLKELIGGGLTTGETVEIVRQVLAGARFAHDKGIVHRDLKPQNVMVNAEGRAMVADFGIARAGVSEITQTGSVLGTAQYLSPEQAQGLEVTARSDLYSVGVILYESLTGRVPFDAETPVAIALKQISERPRPPSELNPEVSRALDAVVLRALAKDSQNRFASADEFLRALAAAEEDPEGGALGDTASYAPVAGAGLAGLAAGGALGAAAAAAADSDDAAAAGAAGAGAAGAGAGAGAGGPGDGGAGDSGDGGGEGSAAGPGGPGNGEGADEAASAGGWMTRRRAAVIGALALLAGGVAAYALTRPDQVRVPEVNGKTERQARGLLDDEGLEAAVKAFPNCAPQHTVTEQDPQAATLVDEGATVTITVSLGQQGRVPAVEGLPERKAAKRLRRANLLVESRTVANERIRAGQAIGTDPAENARVDCNEQVKLLVSQGPSLTTVPDLLGTQEAEARSALEQADLVAKVEMRNSDQPEGTVIAQNPAPGQRLRQGSRVIVTVSNGEGTVIAPNVVGQQRESALGSLTSLGLDVRVVKRTTEAEGEDDLVLEQTPQGGTRLREGDEVTIFVGDFQPPPDEPPPDEPPPDEPPPDEPPPEEPAP